MVCTASAQIVNGFFLGVDDSDWEASFSSFMVIEVGE
jgi:hypothetical protein